MKTFKFWCQKVLPLVYDNSLSYYEVLCKVVDYINNLIEQDKEIIKDVEQLQKEMIEVKQWIATFDTSFVEKIIADYIATMVFFGITDEGYFVAYIPDNWKSIDFNTTGLDIDIPIEPQFGHLVLSY